MNGIIYFFTGGFIAGIPLMVLYLKSNHNAEALLKEKKAATRTHVESTLSYGIGTLHPQSDERFGFLRNINKLFECYQEAGGFISDFAKLLGPYLESWIDQTENDYRLTILHGYSTKELSPDAFLVLRGAFLAPSMVEKVIALVETEYDHNLWLIVKNPLFADSKVYEHFSQKIALQKEAKAPV
ncbi:MAG TPA: hypothetical protein VGE18_02875 [Candidatus Paceibacterota bacterium]